MPCYHPLKGYRAAEAAPGNARKIVFNRQVAFTDLPISVPCGQCIGCRLERSRQWAIRCSHEASLYEENSFVTLTYDDSHLPPTGSLDITHYQKFMKRLRKKYEPKIIRFYHCGEYGENFGRPHYHACLFNHDFKDRVHYKTINKQKYYLSEELTQLWGKGFCLVGDVTFESAAYVARYIMKKITGEAADAHYEIMNKETGELGHLQPEYTTMSRRPGIGSDWLKKYRTDVYPDDFVVIKGRRMKPPKYYDKQHEIEYPSDYARLRCERVRNVKTHAENNTTDRLVVREKVQLARIKNLKRGLEDD